MNFKRTIHWQLRPENWRVSGWAVLPGNVSIHEKHHSKFLRNQISVAMFCSEHFH